MILVSYDIKDDKKRSRFSKFLKQYGRRLQYSVFEIKNSERVLQNILVEVKYRYKNEFDANDSVLIVVLCEACKKKIKRYGYLVNEEEDILFFG